MLGRPQQREELTFCSKAQNITFRGASLLGRGSFYMEHGFIVLGSSERPLSVKSDNVGTPQCSQLGGFTESTDSRSSILLHGNGKCHLHLVIAILRCF